MTLSEADYLLVDSSNGFTLGVESTVIVPEVFGGYGYDILYDPEAAAEYGEQQGVKLSPPGAPGAQLSSLKLEDRPYLALDVETGLTAAPGDLRLIAVSSEEAAELLEEPLETLRARALEDGLIPVVDESFRDAEGLPVESVS